jgi:hypothetical protein
MEERGLCINISTDLGGHMKLKLKSCTLAPLTSTIHIRGTCTIALEVPRLAQQSSWTLWDDEVAAILIWREGYYSKAIFSSETMQIDHPGADASQANIAFPNASQSYTCGIGQICMTIILMLCNFVALSHRSSSSSKDSATYIYMPEKRVGRSTVQANG